MKKLLLLTIMLAVSAVVCTAQQGFFVGGQMGYTIGGDVEESDLGFGAQAGLDINDTLSLELSWNKFSDEENVAEGFARVEADLNVIAATLRAGLPMSDTIKLYAGGGVNYLMIDMSMSLTDKGRNALQTMADYYGIPVEMLMRDSGMAVSGDIEMDNTIGFHICAGAAANITDNIQLFGEYRYTFGKVKGEGIDEDYNYGILRAGVNLLL